MRDCSTIATVDPAITHGSPFLFLFLAFDRLLDLFGAPFPCVLELLDLETHLNLDSLFTGGTSALLGESFGPYLSRGADLFAFFLALLYRARAPLA